MCFIKHCENLGLKREHQMNGLIDQSGGIISKAMKNNFLTGLATKLNKVNDGNPLLNHKHPLLLLCVTQFHRRIISNLCLNVIGHQRL